MTLSELKYIVALAHERHFGRAAQRCFVSQPTLSVAIRKLEDELGVTLFERGGNEVTLTAIGERIVEQAQRVLEQVAEIKSTARQGQDPLAEPLRVGAIYTVGPYLLPQLVPALRRLAPQMALYLEENFTARLAEMLKRGEIDVAILALPFDEPGIVTWAVYDEPFVVALPPDHAWAQRSAIPHGDLAGEPFLLLGPGNCFRDQVLEACPELGRPATTSARLFESGSLETIRYMVASGAGISVLPSTSVAAPHGEQPLLTIRPLSAPVPTRRIALAWRRSFPRPQAITVLRQAILACRLSGTTSLDLPPSEAIDSQ